MVVQCPHCSARYRVNDQNIPSTGGRIRCPSCSDTFVVYPEQPEPAASGPSYDEGKTSVATNINDLMSGLQRGGGFPGVGGGGFAGGGEEDGGATEVISGDSLPGFAGGMFGGGAPDDLNDGTVEMDNPLVMAGIQQHMQQAEEDYDPTQIVSSDVAAGAVGGFHAGVGDGGDKTEVVSPDMMGSMGGGSPFAAPQGGADKTEVVSPDMMGGAFGGGAPQPSFGGAPSPPPQPSFGGGQPPAPQPTGGGAPPAAAGPDPNHDGPWKLKTDFGLTYEFADTKSLLNWMSSRDNFDGHTISAGDEEFFPLEDFPQIAAQMGGKLPQASPSPSYGGGAGLGAAASSPQLGGQQQLGGGFGQQQQQHAPTPGNMGMGGANMGGAPAQQPSAGQGGMRTERPKHNTLPPVVNNEFKPPSRDAKWNKVLWVLFVVLFVGCALLALQVAKVVDFKSMLGMDPPAPVEGNTPPVAKTPGDAAKAPGDTGEPEVEGDGAAPVEVSAEDKAQADLFVEEARAALENNKFIDARSKLESAKLLDPNRFEVYDLLAKVYDETGEAEKAEQMRTQVQALRAEATAGGGE